MRKLVLLFIFIKLALVVPAIFSNEDKSMHSSAGVMHAFRLKPQQDLRDAIETFAKSAKIKAGAIVTCVGSLDRASLRMAGADKAEERDGPFEIVSLVGTVGDGGVHLHISLSDAKGTLWGGHLLKGSTINTTAEIVLVELSNLTFTRPLDPETKCNELEISKQ